MEQPEPSNKILHRRTKMSNRTSGVFLPMRSPVASFSKQAADADGAAAPVSSSASSTGAPKQPMWYRFRTALTTLLVVNAVVVGYRLFRTTSNPSEEVLEKENDANAAEKEEKKDVFPGTSKVVQGTLPNASPREIPSYKVSSEDQLELYRWMLAEKRKVKPANKAEKAQLDADKALLKEYLRRKTVLIS